MTTTTTDDGLPGRSVDDVEALDMLSPAEVALLLRGRLWPQQLEQVAAMLPDVLRVPAETELYEAYFGTCPECFTTNGYINIGASHWFYCAEHKACWYVGSGLMGPWREQTEDEQREIYDDVGFGQFRDVKPAWFTVTPPVATRPDDDAAPF